MSVVTFVDSTHFPLTASAYMYSGLSDQWTPCGMSKQHFCESFGHLSLKPQDSLIGGTTVHVSPFFLFDYICIREILKKICNLCYFVSSKFQ
jgi:hypothetical protein